MWRPTICKSFAEQETTGFPHRCRFTPGYLIAAFCFSIGVVYLPKSMVLLGKMMIGHAMG